jgi:hypothetical protein
LRLDCAIRDRNATHERHPTTRAQYPGPDVAPFWIWMQVVIIVCVLISAVIAVIKLV